MARPTALLAAIAIAASTLSGTALAQGTTEDDVPAVTLLPAVRPETGLAAQALVIELDDGLTGSAPLELINIAGIDQRVRLLALDAIVGETGFDPAVEDGEGFESWLTFSPAELVVPAEGSVVVDASIALPSDVPPGDNVGYAAVETTSVIGDTTVNKRVAILVYATVAGDAVRAMSIESVEARSDNWFVPGVMTTTVAVRNDGRIRLTPTITVADQAAEGPTLLLSRSTELYVASVPVPWYGGIVRLPIRAAAEGGIVRVANVTRFVIPWGLLLTLALLAAIGYAVRHWWQERGSRMAALQADIRRLETLLTRDEAPAQAAAVDVVDEQVRAINQAIKNARRSGNQAALGRLALALHATGANASDALLEGLEQVTDPTERRQLLDAVAAYDLAVLAALPRFATLDVATAEQVTAAATGAPTDIGEEPDGPPAEAEPPSDPTPPPAAKATAKKPPAKKKAPAKQAAKKAATKKTPRAARSTTTRSHSSTRKRPEDGD